MSKATSLLVLVAAVAGGAYVFRGQLEPYAAKYLPTEVVRSIGLATAQADNAPSGGSRAEGEKAAPPAKGGGGRRGGGGGGTAPVTAADAVLADMPVILSAPGTVEAMSTVAVRTRVDGIIAEVGFKEGDYVAAGSVLFKLEDRLVRAQIMQAEATIKRDQASLRDAEAILDRRESLFQKKYASEAATETARQQVEVLKANIEAGQALLEVQKTQLDYLTIRAPISGRTGSVNAKHGALVRSADATPLVTINQTKPIAIGFALPQSNLDSLRSALQSKAKATITVPLTKPVTTEGTLMFVDNQVDKQTGTVTAKVQSDNANELLWPGLAVGIELTVEIRQNLVAVPASSVLPSQRGLIAWVIDGDNRVSIRPVTLERTIGQTSFLTAGLKAGERVVTDGQTRLSEGMTVSIRDNRGGEAAPAADGGKGGGAGKGKGKGGQQGDAQQDQAGERRSNGRS